jgi:hypothetical protein
MSTAGRKLYWRGILIIFILISTILHNVLWLQNSQKHINGTRSTLNIERTNISLEPNSTALQQWTATNTTQKFKLTLKLLTMNRFSSLKRCIASLLAAHYDGDKVDLDIYIDHAPTTWTDGIQVNPQSDGNGENTTESRLRDWRQTQRIARYIANHVHWHPIGEKRIHVRSENVGTAKQWIEAWWPTSRNEFAMFIEDDMEVSPFYYRYLKKAIQRYYYDQYDQRVFGLSLQRQRESWGN